MNSALIDAIEAFAHMEPTSIYAKDCAKFHEPIKRLNTILDELQSDIRDAMKMIAFLTSVNRGGEQLLPDDENNIKVIINKLHYWISEEEKNNI